MMVESYHVTPGLHFLGASKPESRHLLFGMGVFERFAWMSDLSQADRQFGVCTLLLIAKSQRPFRTPRQSKTATPSKYFG